MVIVRQWKFLRQSVIRIQDTDKIVTIYHNHPTILNNDKCEDLFQSNFNIYVEFVLKLIVNIEAILPVVNY